MSSHSQPWKVTPATTGLLVIDPQEKIINAIQDEKRKTLLVESIKMCLEMAEALSFKKTLLFTQNLEKLGSYPAKLLPFTEKYPTHDKEYFSAIRGDNGEERLDELRWSRVDHTIVTGIESHICVFQTVYDLISNGMRVTVPIETTLSIHQDDYRESILAMRAMGARVIPLETLLFELVEKHTSPTFPVLREKLKSWRKYL